MNKTPAMIKDELLKPEKGRSPEIQTRNEIRNILEASFASINVWLFPTPVAETADLSKALDSSMLQPAFTKEVSLLKSSMMSQLREPMCFNGHIMTGSKISKLVPQIAAQLNENKLVMVYDEY